MSAKPVKPRRSYDNRGRAAQAEATQQRIVAAARRLFEADGYVGTSMGAIAEAAEVSVETVFKSFGTKAALLKRVYDVTLAGDDEPLALSERPEFLAVLDAPPGRAKVDAYAALARMVAGRLGALSGAVVASARSGGADLRRFAATVNQERLVGTTAIVGHLADTGSLRPDLDLERARDVVWALISPEVYQLLVLDRGWSLDEYERWLAESLSAALLPADRR